MAHGKKSGLAPFCSFYSLYAKFLTRGQWCICTIVPKNLVLLFYFFHFYFSTINREKSGKMVQDCHFSLELQRFRGSDGKRTRFLPNCHFSLELQRFRGSDGKRTKMVQKWYNAHTTQGPVMAFEAVCTTFFHACTTLYHGKWYRIPGSMGVRTAPTDSQRHYKASTKARSLNFFFR